jgi:hypothetical protein
VVTDHIFDSQYVVNEISIKIINFSSKNDRYVWLDSSIFLWSAWNLTSITVDHQNLIAQFNSHVGQIINI